MLHDRSLGNLESAVQPPLFPDLMRAPAAMTAVCPLLAPPLAAERSAPTLERAQQFEGFLEGEGWPMATNCTSRPGPCYVDDVQLKPSMVEAAMKDAPEARGESGDGPS